MANKMETLLKQVNDAAGELVGMIHELDARVTELHMERQQIGNAPISRTDFLNYIDQAIDAKTARFGKIKSGQIQGIDTSFLSLERGGLQYFNFLLADNAAQADIGEGGLYWYLKPFIMERCAEVADFMGLPEDAMPLGERRTRIAEIDAEISGLRDQRDAMAGQLQKTGLIG